MADGMTRREAGKLALMAGVATVAAPYVAHAAKPKLVVVGGGPGGGTVAKYAAQGGNVDVTLVERDAYHNTCFFSNLYIGDHWQFDKLSHGYDTMSRKHGVNVVHASAEAVEPGKVMLAGGETLAADRVVVSPGIDFKWDMYEGIDAHVAETEIPHAYKAGSQTRLLKLQMEAMEDGGTVIIAAPPNPYRCPPGPYERASMMADWLSKHKPASKILILDPKTKHSKQGLFNEGWGALYPGMVEWVGGEFTGGGFTAVDAKARSVTTADGETYEADVLNFIPAQMAGKIARDSGLTGDGDWAPIDPETLESTVMPGVHVLGDACANGDMPKSGFSANSQAKAVAQAVTAELTGKKAFAPRFRNTCWSLIGEDWGVKVGANYKAGEEKIEKTEGFISEVNEDPSTRAATAAEGYAWYRSITEDIWG